MKWHTGIAVRAALVGFLVTFIGFLASTLYHIYKSMDGERGKGLFEIILSTFDEPMMIYFLVAGLLFGVVYFYFGVKWHSNNATSEGESRLRGPCRIRVKSYHNESE
jgi:predicted membrane protein